MGLSPTRKRLLKDFIIPSLNEKTYGEKLCWIDKERGIFRLYWSHKNAAKWEQDDTQVFQGWDVMKGHYQPQSKNYYMSAKQRFRAALYKLSKYVVPLKSTEKTYRDYQLMSKDIERRNESLIKTKGAKRVNQPAIPTPVICRNTSYISKPSVVVEKQKPAFPSYVSEDKKLPLLNSADMDINKIWKREDSEKMNQLNVHEKCNKEVSEISVLRENSSSSRNTHIAPQPVPVYTPFKYHSHRSLHESPEVFVTPIYRGPENEPQRMRQFYGTMLVTDSELSAIDGILNLCTKPPNGYPSSR